MPRAGRGDPQLVLLAEFRVVIHDLAHQLLDHLLAAGVVHAAGHLGHDFGKRDDNLIAVDGVRLVLRHGIVCKETVDRLDNQTMQAGPFVVVFGVVGNGGSPRQRVGSISYRNSRRAMQGLLLWA